ncbi:MAG: phosphate signaling complex protein PhoU [Candidatus Tectomicrobia bacterium]|nr:phosphate signaling complex protein PhoU [Candidatus Tectomicrobia bacterium]
MAREHLSSAFERELRELKEKILFMGARVEESIADTMKALLDRSSVLAQKVIDTDSEIDELEMEIDEICWRILALRQPAGRDLRFITTGLKISTDLERVGDQAANIAERVLELNEEERLKPYIDLPLMAQKAQEMIKNSLDAMVNEDEALARQVCADDAIVDNYMEQIFRELLTYMLESSTNISRAMRLTFVAKYLERIADHATNIAEMVIYMLHGTDIRHRHFDEPRTEGEIAKGRAAAVPASPAVQSAQAPQPPRRAEHPSEPPS